MAKHVLTTVDIKASTERVWPHLAGLKHYRAWNARTRFSRDPQAGKIQLMRVKLFGLWLPVPVRIQHCSREEGLRWIGGIPLLYTGSHYFRLEPNQGHTTLTQGEDFSGLLVPVLWPLVEKELLGLYTDFNRDLRERCEQHHPGES